MSTKIKIEHEWQVVQDGVIRQILGYMGYRRMTDKAMLKLAKVSKSTWQDAKFLRVSVKIETLVKLSMAVGCYASLGISRVVPQQCRSRAFTIWD